MKYTILILMVLFLSSCSSKQSVCFELEENANVHADFGYFYDSATFDMNGPGKFHRIGKEQSSNPCYHPPTGVTE